ncbi:P-loop containing nucleoside triphosphate hydrolase protein [Mariannaea sp. PMI_226]|nr:P-loop containing nucleoside triphosphate hydrolase protein [Mariannaea sp. PMI_226]
MMRLGSFVRQVRTQTVWLTATLPPVFEDLFMHRNLLVRPRIVREPTNRANIRYGVRRFNGPGGLCKRAAELVRSFHDNNEALAGGKNARIIVYCQTLELMGELADELDCPTYTGDQKSMSEEDREAAIKQWIGPTGSPVIVATSALGVGFDYPYVRWVVHAGAPRRMMDFSQESGRAGRDGKRAESIVLLSAAWQPYAGGQQPSDLDEESMQLYLTQEHCSRAVMSQFLDKRPDWRWCMDGEDELCEVCPKHHTERRPSGLELRLPAPDTKVSCGGSPLLGEGSGGGGEEAVRWTRSRSEAREPPCWLLRAGLAQKKLTGIQLTP